MTWPLPAVLQRQTLLPHRGSRAFSSLPESVNLTVVGGGSDGLSKCPGQTVLSSCQGPIWSWTGSWGPSRVCALPELSPRNVLGPRPALQNGPNAEIHLPPPLLPMPCQLDPPPGWLRSELQESRNLGDTVTPTELCHLQNSYVGAPPIV